MEQDRRETVFRVYHCTLSVDEMYDFGERERILVPSHHCDPRCASVRISFGGFNNSTG